MAKIQILKDINLGQRVAEEEADDLQKYFVKTAHWERLAAGDIDVVYGSKGSGKSALYTSLVQQATAFERRKIIIVSAENPRGATVFKSIATDPPPSETEFTGLWKLYILLLAAKEIRQRVPHTPEAQVLVGTLQDADLLPVGNDLSSYFRSATRYIKGWLGRDKASVEHEISLDPISGMPAVKRKVKYAKGKPPHRKLDDLPLDELLGLADKVLGTAGLKLWVAFDRLDVAFVESPDLERNALRALFRAYNDLKGKSRICPKIFVRDDVWRRITEGGFTEASHITKSLHIEWSAENLLNLLVLRLVVSDKLRHFYKVKAAEIKGSYDKQVELFYRVFPDKVATGRNPETLDWIISRASDGTKSGKPREVIHLVDVSRQNQINDLERGGKEPPEEQLIDRASIANALPLVSKVYFEQTLLAEHPDLKKYLDELLGQKATQELTSLAKIWGVPKERALEIAKRLVDIGFFEKRGANSYWVPFLLRPALSLVQGSSDS
jgi:hypothetical protein